MTKHHPTLIEYSAFFGSINIFNYLKSNGLDLNEKLLLYAIYGRNPEIIQIIEDNNKLTNKWLIKYILTSIKCFHDEIADYFNNNYYIIQFKDYWYKFLNYFNFKNIEFKDLNKQEIFFYSCESCNKFFADTLLKGNEANINGKTIFTYMLMQFTIKKLF